MSFALDEKYPDLYKIVEKELAGYTGHTLDHIERVWKTAMRIAAANPEVDLEVLQIAILMHDIAGIKEETDNTGKTDHALLGAEITAKKLSELKYPEQLIKEVKHCIQTHRFRSSFEPKSIEAKILFDADKIDVLGAIGVARSFMIAGDTHESLYSFTPLKEYIADNLVGGKADGRIKDVSKHTPNLEFETKIIKIPQKLYTDKGREIAVERMKFMAEFFARLSDEISTDI
jgi:uncharacterized protein